MTGIDYRIETFSDLPGPYRLQEYGDDGWILVTLNAGPFGYRAVFYRPRAVAVSDRRVRWPSTVAPEKGK